MERDRNESGQYADGIDPETVLDVVDAREDLGRPVTAGDVVDELGIARRTAHNKLGALVERGVLETRKIGARGRVWWRPIPADSVDTQPPRDARHSPETPAGDEREPRGRVLEGSMTLSNDEFAALGLGLGLGLGVGTGATLMSPAFGIGMGVAGMVAILYATQQKRNGEPEDDDCVESDDVATDGGTVRRETPQTAATEHPTVLDIDVVGDRALASVEKGDVSVVVEAPAGFSAEELEQTLSGVPKSIERTTRQFAETPRMSDDTTELDGSIDTEDATEDDLGGGV